MPTKVKRARDERGAIGKEALHAWLQLLAAQKSVVAAVTREMELRGFSLSWYEVLVRVAQAPGGKIRMQDLARQVLLSESGTTRVVEKLEAARLLRRAPSADDQRGRECSLSDEGRERLEALRPVFFSALQTHLGDRLTKVELQTLAGLLAKLT